MQKKNNPLNGRGNAMVVAAPAMFGVCEAIFHANPIVGGALGILAGAIAYRHYDDVAYGVDRLASGTLKEYTPINRSEERAVESSIPSEKPQSKVQDFRDMPIPIGADRSGKRFERTMRQLKSILILGLQEGGKSNSAIHILRHMVKNGARLAIIDKHARSEEDSMTSKMRYLESWFDCPVGTDPYNSMDVVAHVRAVLDERLEGGKCSYPLFLVVDEFTAIMRQKEEGGKWQSCGQVLASLIEDINTEGRKHQVFAICIGQIANVSRTGGGEIRELFVTRIVHAMSQKQANLLGLTEINKQVESLRKGEVFFQTEGFNAFWLKIPYVETAELKRLASTLPAIEKTKPCEEVNREVFSALAQDYPEMEDLPMKTQVLPETAAPKKRLIQAGVTNDTKEPVYITEDVFELLLNAARVGSPMSIKSIMALTSLSEQHSKNVASMVREQTQEVE